jgi:hypothetical protein
MFYDCHGDLSVYGEIPRPYIEDDGEKTTRAGGKKSASAEEGWVSGAESGRNAARAAATTSALTMTLERSRRLRKRFR